jgi:polyhydroxyalkanoate synthesis regulator phasin
MSKSSSILILLLTGIVMSMVTIFPIKQMVYGHTFSGDESAAFLALVRQIEAEIGLVNSNLPSNITLAQEHAEHATEHLDANTTKELTERNERVSNDLTRELSDLQASINAKPSPAIQVIYEKVANINATLQDAIAVRIEQDQLSNSTVNALAINDILGEVLEHYGAAYGIEEEEGEEEHGNETDTTDNTTETAAGSNTTANTTVNTTVNTTAIINLAEYQSAQAYANESKQMLDELKTLAPSNTTSTISNVENGINEMITAINNKAPFTTVDEIVDSKVLPSLKTAFNLPSCR